LKGVLVNDENQPRIKEQVKRNIMAKKPTIESQSPADLKEIS
jgi:hypothetical protein